MFATPYSPTDYDRELIDDTPEKWLRDIAGQSDVEKFNAGEDERERMYCQFYDINPAMIEAISTAAGNRVVRYEDNTWAIEIEQDRRCQTLTDETYRMIWFARADDAMWALGIVEGALKRDASNGRTRCVWEYIPLVAAAKVPFEVG